MICFNYFSLPFLHALWENFPWPTASASSSFLLHSLSCFRRCSFSVIRVYPFIQAVDEGEPISFSSKQLCLNSKLFRRLSKWLWKLAWPPECNSSWCWTLSTKQLSQFFFFVLVFELVRMVSKFGVSSERSLGIYNTSSVVFVRRQRKLRSVN